MVGYGPTGRTVTRLLRENGFAPTVIDLNVNTVRELRDQGMHAIYGDATTATRSCRQVPRKRRTLCSRLPGWLMAVK